MLHEMGFTNLAGELWFDKDKTPEYVTCYYRLYNGQHQYVTLTTYDGGFVEGWFQVYGHPYNSRAKVRQVPLGVGLPRNMEDLLKGVNQVYSLPEKTKTR